MLYQAPRRVAIINSRRIPFCRANTAYKHQSNQDMMTTTLQSLIDACGLGGQRLGDVALGAVMKHSRDWNLARECVLGTTLAPETPAYDLTRACGTSLEAAIQLGNKIATGPDRYRHRRRYGLHQRYSGGLSGRVPRDPARQRPRPVCRREAAAVAGARPRMFKPETPGVVEPRTGLSMGQSTELTAKQWGISRGDQDQLALESHQKAARAYDEGFYKDLVDALAGRQRGQQHPS